jgi:K+-transporting ATPase ATPase C chain
MTSLLRPAFVLVCVFTLLLGVAAPFAMTGIAGAVFPDLAGGSLVTREGRVVGSALIGQGFASDRYFHPRPSATSEADPENPGSTRPAPYNAASSAASQLGPTSAALRDSIVERVGGRSAVPADAVTGSGSGLDPHISPENARRQIGRVAAARSIPETRIAALVVQHVETGLLGTSRVNVLRLNLALDRLN